MTSTRIKDMAMVSSIQSCDPDELLTVAEVAALLRVSEAWVRDHATRKQPRLPAIKLGKLLRFRRGDVMEFLENLKKWAA